VFHSSQRVESVLWMTTSLAFDHAQPCGGRACLKECQAFLTTRK